MPTHPRRGWSSRGWFTTTIAVVLAAGFGSGPAEAGEKKRPKREEEVDHVSLAAKLIKDGLFDRAQMILDQADPEEPGLDLPRYHTLKGLVALEQKRFEAARQSLDAGIAAGQRQPAVFLYLAKANFGMKDFPKVLEALDEAGESGRELAGTYLMRAQSHWELGDPAKAITALEGGEGAFPDEPELTRLKLFYLIELGLFQEVVRVGETYLSRMAATAEDYAAVGEGLRRSKQLTKAQEVLESARIRFPQDERILVLLAHAYLDEDRPFIAAMLFEDASRLDPKYALEAAELYLRAERYERALTLNARVVDQAAKIKQRLSILLKLERHETVATMAPRLARLGLLDDENIRYALAYGFFKIGDFQQAEEHLRQLRDPRLFDSAMQLRRAMETCMQAGWACN